MGRVTDERGLCSRRDRHLPEIIRIDLPYDSRKHEGNIDIH